MDCYGKFFSRKIVQVWSKSGNMIAIKRDSNMNLLDVGSGFVGENLRAVA